MHPELSGLMDSLTFLDALRGWLLSGYLAVKVVIGFSIIIFVHELGHFLAAKWMGIRVDRFAVGFLYRLCGYRRGEGFTFGRRPNYRPEELAAKGYGETDYCLNALPFGGYVKMMGEDDLLINEQTGAVKTTNDPRAFPNKPVSRRMVVVSAGVLFNLLFALLLYMFVFLALGKEATAPVVGQVDVGSPAARAGLLPGDRVLKLNGKPVESFEDVLTGSVLSEGPVRLEIERRGQPLEVQLDADLSAVEQGRPPLGFRPMLTTTVSETIASVPDPQGLKPNDQITHVNGVPVDSRLGILTAFESSGGRPVEFTVQRTDPQHPNRRQTLTLAQRPTLLLGAADVEARDQVQVVESQHLLGFLRRQSVFELTPGWAGAQAGFQPGDVIAQWGTVANPLFRDINASIEASEGQPIPVVVERGGQPVALQVTPRRPFSLFGSAPLRAGLAFIPEAGRPVVADVVPDTPAAQLNMPRGAQILSVGDRPVHTWSDVFEALKAAAGTTVAIRYQAGDNQVTGRMRVPSSIVNELHLPPTAEICSIDGESMTTLESGKRSTLPAEVAVRRLLEKSVGRTVTVEYVLSPLDLRRQRGTFAVQADNLDPWQMRGVYGYELANQFTRLTVSLDAGGNPLRAVAMASRQTGRVLAGVFQFLRSMVSPRGKVSVKNVSGPVGIFQLAVSQAESGYGDLLFFLAFISVNLAVINFLPVPVVDGGLMIFLALEKVRGKPLNVKVQVITTLAGLALIVLVFVFVTFQDIAKWWGGNL
jgi:regulator of sigma E protease